MLQLFKNFLETLQIEVTDEDKDTISFKFRDMIYLFVFEASDPNYFRIILPNIFKLKKEDLIFYSLINSLNQKFKVAKLFIDGDKDVWIVAEQFVYSLENVDQMFARCIGLLYVIMEDFRSTINKKEEK